MSGDCRECGRGLLWGGMGWGEHSELYHQGVREGLLMAAVWVLAREAEVRAWEAQNAAQGLVGVRWRCGVYPGWQSERRTTVPYGLWNSREHNWRGQYLADAREHLACLWEARYGVKVNPATWFHRVYDPRVKGEKP